MTDPRTFVICKEEFDDDMKLKQRVYLVDYYENQAGQSWGSWDMALKLTAEQSCDILQHICCVNRIPHSYIFPQEIAIH